MFFYTLIGLFILIAIIAIASIRIVDQQTVLIIERLGRFNRMAYPGLNFIIPIIEKVSGGVTLRIQQIANAIEVRTVDNLFVTMNVHLQYFVPENHKSIFDAYYKLSDVEKQVASYLSNTTRSIAGNMSIDDLFKERSVVEDRVRADLEDRLTDFGLQIKAVLLSAPEPSQSVKHSFDRVAAAQREFQAAELEANTLKVKIVGEAQGHADARKLQGQGIADQRVKIAEGFAKAIQSMTTNPDISTEHAIAFLTLSNQLEAIRDASAHPGTLILAPYSAQSGMMEFAAMVKALSSKNSENSQPSS